MTTAVSQVSIANGALQALGSSSISAFDQDHPNARSVAQSYDDVRRALLREYTWNFAIKRASLPALTSQTVWGDLNQFLLPNDFIKLLRPTDQRVDWQIEGRNIVSSDDAPLEMRYVADIEDPAVLDSAFVALFQIDLALTICEEVTSSTAKKQGLMQDRKEAVKVARFSNAIERDADVPLPDDFILAMR